MPGKYISFTWKHINENNEILKRGNLCIDTFEDRYNPSELIKEVIKINGLDPLASIILEEVRYISKEEFKP